MAGLSIITLMRYFSGEEKAVERGENHYKSGHVNAYVFEDGVISGKVSASMKNKEYSVKVFLDDSLNITKSTCECPKGLYKCSHAAALIIHGVHNMSRTDVPCQWTRKRPNEDNTKSASEMFPLKNVYNPLKRKINDEDRLWLQEELQQQAAFTGNCWLMSPEPENISQHPLFTLDKVLKSPKFIGARVTDKATVFSELSSLSAQDIEDMAKLSKGQRRNEAWYLLRQHRLTASNFGTVLQAKKVTTAMVKRLTERSCLQGVKAINWGNDNEENAIKAFCKDMSTSVEETGVWLHTSGLLGASPDGLVGQDAIVEVKCPFTHRDKNINECIVDTKFCLDGELCLKRNHIYRHQVQGQLYMTGRKLCFFVVWTLKDMAIVKVNKDPEWSRNIPKLISFYMTHIFPTLV